MPHVNCPSCKAAYTVSEQHAGKTVRCKKCGSAFRVAPMPPAKPEASTGVRAAQARPGSKAAPSRQPRTSRPPVATDHGRPEPHPSGGKEKSNLGLLIGAGVVALVVALGVTVPVVYFMTRNKTEPRDLRTNVDGKDNKPQPDQLAKDSKPKPDQAALAWKELTSEDGRFSVSFPGTPEKTSQDRPAGPVQSYVLALGGEQTFTVTWNDLEGTEGLDPKIFLDTFAKQMAANAKDKKEVKTNGHPGVELQMDQDEGGMPMAMTQRIYFVKGRLFQLIVTGARGKQDPAATARFFDSFKPSETPAVAQVVPPKPPIDPPKPPIDPPKPSIEKPETVAEAPMPPDRAAKPPVEVSQPPGPGSMRERAIAWVKANNAFGPTHKIVKDVTNHFSKDLKEQWGFSLMMDGGLLKSKKPTMLAGWNEGFFVFEFRPEQAASLKLAKNTMVFKGIAQDKVQTDKQPITLSDLRIANAGALGSDEKITGSVAYKTKGEVRGTVLMLRLSCMVGKSTRVKFQSIGQTMPAESGTLNFSFWGVDSADWGFQGPLVLFFDLYEHTGQVDRRPVLSNAMAAAVVVTPPSYAALVPPSRKTVSLDKLEVKLPTGWKANYNKFLQSWDFEKYTPAPSGFNEANSLRVATVIDEPADVDAYAEKLKQKDYIDLEYVFSKITAKEKLPDGFLVKGEVSNYKNSKEQPRLGLAMIRTIAGVRVYGVSTSLRSEPLRQEAIELFKSARLPKGQK
jgi:predicted Zn finger-like uncharacterized protein